LVQQRGNHRTSQEHADHTERQPNRDFIEVHDQHLCSDERQHTAQADLQVVELVHHSCKQEVERTQAENREDVGGKDDERIGGHTKDGGDGIDREDDVRALDHEQDQEQRSSPELSLLHHEELGASVVGYGPHEATKYLEH